MVEESNGQGYTDPTPGTNAGASVPAGAVVVRRRRSIWDDSAVRTMAWTGAAVFAAFLLTIVLALYFGFIGLDRAPRTASERDLTGWETAARRDGSADQYQSYVLALITAEEYDKAKSVMDEVNANKKVDQERGFNMLFCLGELQRTQGETAKAIKTYDQVMKKCQDAYNKEYDKGGEFQNWAVSYGRHQNYYLAALGKGIILRDQKKWKPALEMFDIYLMNYPREANILIDRGNIKAALNDKKGAEEDYRAALRFIPDNQDALDGLKKIGVDK